jgi:DNA-binding IclR family transcriptional regulator
VLEEAVLSAFPETAGTTLAKIAKASRRTSGVASSAIDLLIEHGLAEAAGPTRHRELYRLTLAGRGHWQRRPARTADLPPLPVKSDRVRLVLTHLAEHGPTRTHTIGQALDIPRASINALMQYLKRKGLVRKSGTDLRASHELTAEGEKTLRGM